MFRQDREDAPQPIYLWICLCGMVLGSYQWVTTGDVFLPVTGVGALGAVVPLYFNHPIQNILCSIPRGAFVGFPLQRELSLSGMFLNYTLLDFVTTCLYERVKWRRLRYRGHKPSPLL